MISKTTLIWGKKELNTWNFWTWECWNYFWTCLMLVEMFTNTCLTNIGRKNNNNQKLKTCAWWWRIRMLVHQKPEEPEGGWWPIALASASNNWVPRWKICGRIVHFEYGLHDNHRFWSCISFFSPFLILWSLWSNLRPQMLNMEPEKMMLSKRISGPAV